MIRLLDSRFWRHFPISAKKPRYVALFLVGAIATFLLTSFLIGKSPDAIAQTQLNAQSSLAVQEAPTPATEELSQDSIDPQFLFERYPKITKLLVQRAFLRGAIYFAEGTYLNRYGYNPYQISFTYRTFHSFQDHPRIDIPIRGTSLTSDASGACQFLSSTWDGLRRNYPDIWFTDVPKFHPKNQDLGCSLLLIQHGSYEALMAGVKVVNGEIQVEYEAFKRAVNLACDEWASFECANGRGNWDVAKYGYQKAKPIAIVWERFQRELKREQEFLFPGETVIASRTPEEGFPSELQDTLKLNETVGGFRVSDPRRIRPVHPITGRRNVWHRGVDIATPVGTPLKMPTAGTVSCHDDGVWGTYAVFETITFPGRFWLSHHLSECNAAPTPSPKGTVFAKTGSCRDDYCAPHWHLEGWRFANGQWEHYDFAKGWAVAFLKGQVPGR
jgi:muramidase (phage lysozyme)